jgi:fumarate hydratase class I
MPDFSYQEILPLGHEDTPWKCLTTDFVSTFEAGGRTFLAVDPQALTLLTREAMRDIAHLLRPVTCSSSQHPDDPEASANDRFVARDLLQNANIAAGGVLPMCQDTGTAIVSGKKGQRVFTGGGTRPPSPGCLRDLPATNLRYSQLARWTCTEEKNTGTNLPAQIELAATARRRLPTSSCSWPRAAGARTRATCTRRPRRSSTRGG